MRGLGSRLEEVKEGRRDRGKPGEQSPGAKERSAHRRREGSAHQILLKVRSVETEPTTGLAAGRSLVTLTKVCLQVAFREQGRGSGDSEVSERAPKETAEWARPEAGIRNPGC